MKKVVKKEERDSIPQAVAFLCQEKDIPEERIYAAIENALRSAYKKNLPKGAIEPVNISASVDRRTGAMRILARMLAAEEVTNPALQITLEEARRIDPTARLDDLIEVDVTPHAFLRVAAQAAKQVIMQTVREAERGRIYEEFSEKKDEILTAIILREDQNGNVIVSLGHSEGVLSRSDRIPEETFSEGDHVKVYVADVSRVAMGGDSPQVSVTRIHPGLVKRLFELEVPEIAGGIVTIKSIAREAGSRTKIAVYSDNAMIDPVGACVGPRGSRVDRVVNELAGEKIDIIKWSEDPVEFVANALNPAHVLAVYTADGTKNCRVVVPDNQLSLAIGKEGQNARLAAKLTGWKIDIKSESQAAELTDMVSETSPVAEPIALPEIDPSVSFSGLDLDLDLGDLDMDDTL